ncbi:hypothetical protein vseg_012039 [Gypsophila vaccaria]
MATIHHQPYHHSTTSSTSRRPRRRHSLDYSSLPSSSSTTSSATSISHIATLSVSASSTACAIASGTWRSQTGTSSVFSLDALEGFLAQGDFRQADEETRRLLIVLAGEAAVKRGYVFFSEVQFIPKEDLRAVDELWTKYTDGRFGYSVQKKIWLKANKDFTRFFMKVGWMKKLDTEIEQFNYRAFPNEFIWELNTNKNDNETSDNKKDVVVDVLPPEGHLPLTNALRGTQLLAMILTHPAFDEDGNDNDNDDDEKRVVEDEVVVEEVGKKKSRLATLRDRLFKPNYSF